MLTDTSKGWRIHSTSIKAANKRKMRGVQTDLKRSCQNRKKKNSSLTKRHAEQIDAKFRLFSTGKKKELKWIVHNSQECAAKSKITA